MSKRRLHPILEYLRTTLKLERELCYKPYHEEIGAEMNVTTARVRQISKLCTPENFNRLKKRTRKVILSRADGATLEEVGSDIGLSKERVRQIEAKGLEILRDNDTTYYE